MREIFFFNIVYYAITFGSQVTERNQMEKKGRKRQNRLTKEQLQLQLVTQT